MYFKSLEPAHFVRCGATICMSKLKREDWERIILDAVYVINYHCGLESFPTFAPNADIIKEGWREEIYNPSEWKDSLIILSTAEKNTRHVLTLDSPLVPICPLFNSGGNINYRKGWTKNGQLFEKFLLKVGNDNYDWVIMTRRLTREKFKPKCEIWEMKIHARQLSFKVVNLETVVNYIKAYYPIGHWILVSFERLMKASIQKREDEVKHALIIKESISGMLSRLNYQ